MEPSRNQFPHDQDNRIQKLYYDIDINTIFSCFWDSVNLKSRFNSKIEKILAKKENGQSFIKCLLVGKKTFAMKKSSKFLNFFFKHPLQSKPLIFVKMTRI